MTHGERRQYRAGCRCVPCRAANAAYEARRARLRARGGADRWVSPTAARRRLQELAALGIGVRRAAKLAQVAAQTVRACRSGKSAHIRFHVEQAILGIQKPSLAHGQRVNAYRTVYLLQCLVKEGLTPEDIGRRIGMPAATIRGLLHNRTTVDTALKVQALYEDITAEGPSATA